jgi:hypothetical protein
LTEKPSFFKSILSEIEVNHQRIRDFGRVMLVVISFIIPLFLIWRNDWSLTTASSVFFGAGLAIFMLSLVKPDALRGIYRYWMALAVVLGLFMTKVIISLVFYLLMTPIGLMRRAWVGDPLKIRFDKKAESYWIEKEVRKPAPESYEKQY